MTYRPGWRGHLKVDKFGVVTWDGKVRGQVTSRQVEGAKSPGGMVTNTVWLSGNETFASMTDAIVWILKQPVTK